jgi:DHA1 family multidrug resistance protein-like MFS transporter
MLFAARALAGILSSATLPTAMAYIGDSTSRENRGGGMGMIGAAMGIGMVLGPGLGGTLASASLSTPFLLAGALSLVALLLIVVALPESKPAQATIQEARPALRGPQIGAMLEALTGPIGVLLFLAFLLSFGLTNFEGIFGLYAAQEYLYQPREVGIVLTVIGLTSAIMQGAVTGPATKRFGEVRVIRVSLFATSLGFVLLTLPRTFPQVLLACTFLVFSNSMISPAVSSLISKRTDRPQGVTMGVTNSFMSLGRIIGPLWAGFVFDIGANLPYLTGAAIMMAGFIISIVLLHYEPSDRQAVIQPLPESE